MSARVLEEVIKAAGQAKDDLETLYILGPLMHGAKMDSKENFAKINRLAAARAEALKESAEPWWARVPLSPGGCGAWFMTPPRPVMVTRPPAPALETGDAAPRWHGRYAALAPVPNGYEEPPEVKDLTPSQSLRLALSRMQMLERKPVGRGRRFLTDLVDSLLKREPNDDLRLLKAQLVARQASPGRRRLDGPLMESALILLDEIKTDGGAWPLAKAALRARLQLGLGREADARKSQEVFVTRGFEVAQGPQ
jgi:hypothetical protein